MKITWEGYGATDTGRVREQNEDSIRCDGERGIFLIADGMGGHAAGEVASRLAADAAFEWLVSRWVEAESPATPEERLEGAFAAAYEALVAGTEEDPARAGMGTTLTILLLSPHGALAIGHVGDCRVYRLASGELHQLTVDHTVVQKEIEAGLLAEADARHHPGAHLLTRVLIAHTPPEPDLITTTVHPEEILLLCSDGLHTMLDGPTILDVLLEKLSPSAMVRSLLEAANTEGGLDNISAIAVRID